MAGGQFHFGRKSVVQHQRVGEPPGDEHEIARGQREAVARAFVDRVRLGPDVLHAHVVGRRHHLHFDFLICKQEARHQYRRAGRNVIAECRAPRAVIWRHRAIVRVVLVDAHDIAVAAAARFQHASEVREYPVRLATVFRAVPIGQCGAHHIRRHAAGEIRVALVAGGENPIARLDAGRVQNIALLYRDGQQRFDRRFFACCHY